jgi:hypothetical protein
MDAINLEQKVKSERRALSPAAGLGDVGGGGAAEQANIVADRQELDAGLCQGFGIGHAEGRTAGDDLMPAAGFTDALYRVQYRLGHDESCAKSQRQRKNDRPHA